MPPKRRSKDKHLPPRVYYKHQAYFYVTKENKWIRLGAQFNEAMDNWVKIIGPSTKRIFTMNDLFDRYMKEVSPLRAQSTHKSNTILIKPLRIWFGEMQPDEIEAQDIYRYIDKRGEKTKTSANREKSLLSHVFTMAIRWGVVKINRCRDVRRHPEKPRDRYVTDEEFLAVRNIAPEKIKLIMDFAYLTGQRIGDVLKVKLSDFTNEGINIIQNKTGTKLLILWSDALRECVDKAKKLNGRILQSLNLFCKRGGLPMTYDGFSSMWQRIMQKAVKEKLIESSFTFHDLRAKAASDAENLTHASTLLGHSNEYLTLKTYVRKPIKIATIGNVVRLPVDELDENKRSKS